MPAVDWQVHGCFLADTQRAVAGQLDKDDNAVYFDFQ